MAVPKWFWPREYADRVYSDSSRYIRYFFRALFKKGEQLWDSDMNNNLLKWDMWVGRFVNYRKYQTIVAKAPIYSPVVTTHIIDPVHAYPDPGVENCVYYYARGMREPLYLPPLPGHHCYVRGDRNMVIFTDEGWKPYAKVKDEDANVEIAIFASIGASKKGKVMCRYKVDRQFTFYRKGTRSRVRGLDYTSSGFILRKNGMDVGIIWQTVNSSGMTPMGDVTFFPGDMLEIFIPETSNFYEPVSITLIGGLS